MQAIMWGLAVVIILVLSAFLYITQRQLSVMNRQLENRLSGHTRQPIRLQLLNGELNRLAARINQSFKAEENLRLKVLREEQHFREMIVGLSHDLRTPLTAIKGYLQLMQEPDNDDNKKGRTGERYGPSAADRDTHLRTAQKHADVLGGLIEQFFEYAYLLNAGQELRPQRLNLTNLTAEALAASAASLEERGLDIRFEAGPQVYGLADRQAFERILLNLIRNGAQHARGRLEVAVRTAGNAAVLTFRNAVPAGTALDPERLFDRFYTGSEARTSGTGLGLSIVKLLAERMGGSVSALMQEGILEIRVELPAEP